MADHLRRLEEAAEREIQDAPTQRQQILQRYEAEATCFVQSRRHEKRLTNYKSLVWGEAVSGGLLALGEVFGWGILSAIGIVSFLTCLGNTLFYVGESTAIARLHGYVFSGTLILLALVFMNLPQKNYDAESVYRIQYKRNSVPYKAEVMSGTDMQVREQRRLQQMKNVGIVPLLIGGVVLLCRIALDVKANAEAE